MQGELWRRSRYLVAHLVGEVDEAGEVRLPDLIASAGGMVDEKTGRERWSAKTIENTVRDLVAFGALRVVQRGRDRVLSSTVLGRAWRAGILLPGIGGLALLEDAVAELFEDLEPVRLDGDEGSS